MTLVAEIIILTLSLAVLGKSSHLMIDSSVKVAKLTRLGELAVGFIVLSMITTIPEFSISVIAIKSQEVGISVGNILGSNITNICLILGLIALRKPLEVTEHTLRNLLSVLPALAMVALALVIIPNPNRIVGVVLILGFIFFVYYSIRKGITVERLRTKEPEDVLQRIIKPIEIYRELFLLIIGFLGVFLSSRFAVSSSSNIALFIGIPKIVIGSTIMALGTSLPELATTWQAVREGHKNLAVGNIIGSCMINITFILGMVILLSPFNINMAVFSEVVVFVLLSTVFLWTFLGSWGRRKLDRLEGLILIVMYVIFVIGTFVVGM